MVNLLLFFSGGGEYCMCSGGILVYLALIHFLAEDCTRTDLNQVSFGDKIDLFFSILIYLLLIQKST